MLSTTFSSLFAFSGKFIANKLNEQIINNNKVQENESLKRRKYEEEIWL